MLPVITWANPVAAPRHSSRAARKHVLLIFLLDLKKRPGKPMGSRPQHGPKIEGMVHPPGTAL
jgi:hypothetical protein